MKTDVKTEEIVKSIRRKVFWRLYTLPWILMVIFLAIIMFDLIYKNVTMNKEYKSKIEESQLMGIELGKKEIHKESIDIGYGKWIINREGTVQFEWVSSTNRLSKVYITKTNDVTRIITNEIVRVITNEIVKVITNETVKIVTNEISIPNKMTRSHLFGIDDYDLAKRIGLDIEKSMIEDSQIAIRMVFATSDVNVNYSILEKRILEDVTKVIRSGFDGFETYHKTK